MEVKELIGKTLENVVKNSSGAINYNFDEIIFTTNDGKTYKLYHDYDYGENVYVDDICGNLDDLTNSPILQAEENSNSENPPGITKEYQDSFTWTFYRFATAKGFVVIRWYGESNGYYSERVDFAEVK